MSSGNSTQARMEKSQGQMLLNDQNGMAESKHEESRLRE